MSGETTAPNGDAPTGIVAIVVFVAVLITETEFDDSLITYTRCAFGLIAIPVGLVPTGIVVTKALVLVFITETELAV